MRPWKEIKRLNKVVEDLLWANHRQREMNLELLRSLTISERKEPVTNERTKRTPLSFLRMWR